MRIESGLVIDNRFRLLSLVGASAFGSLWRAADRVPGKKVAIRIIGDPGLGAAALEAFHSEMKSATAVRHRSLARIYAAGRDSTGAVWFARELVDGESLESVLERKGPLTPEQALTLISDLAGVLAEVHALGLAHGAVSARMVRMPRSNGDAVRPMLIGIGRARLLGSKQPRLTAHGLPEAAYFSPEVFATRQYSAASDIWSLGVLLFRCVSGRLPFSARNEATMHVETRRLNRLLTIIEDADVRTLIAECFALDPDARPNASQLARRARVLACEVLQEQQPARVSPPPLPVRIVPAPVESSPPPVLVRPEPVVRVVPEPPPVVAPQTVAAAVPFNDVDLEVDFRPRRVNAKVIAGAIAVAAIFVELIIATREPPRQAPIVAHVESEPVQTPAPPPAPVEIANATTLTPPAASTIAPAPVAPVAKPPPAAARKAKPRPANKADNDNPYE